MYVFDTNVLSELMRAAPDPAVVTWLKACPVEAMFTTTICQTEVLYGARRLPDSRRRSQLIAAARELFETTFAGRLLAFDPAAAAICADIRIGRERTGKPITAEDSMIAAIAQARGATIVTRDRDLSGCGISVVNPWAAL
jgi:toxin FitB